MKKGLGKLILNESRISDDLEKNWAVIAEAIQTILRREGYPNPYETLKALTRTGKAIDKITIEDFIDSLSVSEQVKDELRKVNALKVQYTCFPKNVQVQRRLEPSGAVSNSLSAYSKADGDIHIQLSANDKLLYGGNNGKAIDPDDLFALAKQDVEKNNGVSFYLIVDDGSSYGAYSSAVQTLYYAFKSVREDLAMKTYGKPYDLLKMDQQDELMAKCRANIFEVRYLLSMVK